MRLAYEQGLLKQHDLNHFQHWALMYYLYMERRIRMEDKQADLEQQCLYLFPDRWRQLHLSEYYESAFGIEPEMPVNDLDEIDRFMQSLGDVRTMSGADIEEDRWLV